MIRYADSRTLGLCPAAVYMDSGDIEINLSVWGSYTPFQQRFILYHEMGHYLLQTSSEERADRYALHRLYATAPQSLKQSLGTLARLHIPDSRLEALYRECLLLDAQRNQNPRAQLELIHLVKTWRAASQPQYGCGTATAAQKKTQKTMKPSKLKEVKMYRADGLTVENPTAETVDAQDQKVDAIINKMYEREMSGGDYGFERRFNFKHHMQTLLLVVILLFCVAIWRQVR